MFDAEKMRRVHGDAIGYISYPPMEGQLKAMYERMAQATNAQIEAEVKPWRELVWDIVQMFELDEHFTLSNYEDVMARAKAMLGTLPELKHEEKP